MEGQPYSAAGPPVSRFRGRSVSERGERMAGGEFEGRVAVITGGGRGFGKAFGHALAQRGARVVLADIDSSAGDEASAELRKAGGEALALSCDVADEAQVQGL